MAKIHRKVKKFRTSSWNIFEPHLKNAERTFGKEKTDKLFDDAHPIGTQLDEQEKAKEALEAQLNAPPPKAIPLADEEALRSAKRREAARRRRGRSSTILGGSKETLG